MAGFAVALPGAMSHPVAMRWAMVLIGLLGCLGGGGCMTGSTPHKLVWRTLSKGLVSGLVEPRRQVIHDEAEYLRVWTQHAAPSNRIGLPPAVDFSREMVLVVAMGRRPTGGYLIEVVDLELRGKTLRVLVGERNPVPGSMQIQQATEPVVFVALPAMSARVDFRTVKELVPAGANRRGTRPGSEPVPAPSGGGKSVPGEPAAPPVYRPNSLPSPRGATR